MLNVTVADVEKGHKVSELTQQYLPIGLGLVNIR